MIFLRFKEAAKEGSLGDIDLDELFYLNLSQDYHKFMHRVIIFYNKNYLDATENNSIEAKERLKMLINRILPPAKELKKILK